MFACALIPADPRALEPPSPGRVATAAPCLSLRLGQHLFSNFEYFAVEVFVMYAVMGCPAINANMKFVQKAYCMSRDPIHHGFTKIERRSNSCLQS